MQKPDPSPVDVFLATVQGQLRGLEEPEEREILQELADHLRDSELRWRSEAAEATEEDVVARAIAAMGDPVQIGRRIREEHLSQRLPLGEAVLTAAPATALALSFFLALFLSPLLPTLFSPSPPDWLPWVLLSLGPALLLPFCLWGLSRGHRLWLATSLGYLLVLGAIVVPVLLVPISTNRHSP